MHLLYLDDSGSAGNPSEEYLVLGGVALYEAQTDWITRQLDDRASQIDPSNPLEIEFHASEIFSRRNHPWDKMSKEDAIGEIKGVLGVLRDAYKTATIFACAVKKSDYPNRDPMEIAFEDLCSRFDKYLERLRTEGDRQRGLLIMDQSSQETSLQRLSHDIRLGGTRWGVIKHLADVPLFVDSRMSRAIQLADHVAYAVFRRYNAGDSSYLDLIAHRFDESDGIVHGLSHIHRDHRACMCFSCITRRG